VVKYPVNEKTRNDYKALSEKFKEQNYLALRRTLTNAEARMLLAGAMNKELFYDVVVWARRNRLSSKPTFSRRKNFLKKLDIIKEEKVPIGYGRPRIRLVLNNAKFNEIYGFGVSVLPIKTGGIKR